MTTRTSTTTTVQSTETETTRQPVATNAVTGKGYFGDKARRLQQEGEYRGYSSHEWATMKQWNKARQTIAKGEKGTLVLFYEQPQEGDEAEAQTKRVFLFNRCQLERFKAVDCGDKAF